MIFDKFEFYFQIILELDFIHYTYIKYYSYNDLLYCYFTSIIKLFNLKLATAITEMSKESENIPDTANISPSNDGWE